MARPIKKGLDYFELDCQLNKKVKLIQAEYGLTGFAIIIKLFQKIYGEFGYYCDWNEEVLLLFVSENGLPGSKKNLVDEIVRACITRGIFSETLFDKYGILTSATIQRRYLNATSRREKIEVKKEYLLLSLPKNQSNSNNNSVNVCNNSVNASNNTQRREEKSRVNNNIINKVQAPYYEDEKLNQTFLAFVEMRKKLRKPMTPTAIKLAMNKLQELAGLSEQEERNIELAIKILEQSIMNGWLSLYPLKNDNTVSFSGKKGFNNFPERDYDYEALEKQLLKSN